MQTFIKTCRREWKRLGVPDRVANEMASELEADLTEAESEGASAEDVLGSGVFDPRSFAVSWAAERGVIRPEPSRPRLPWRSPMLAAIVALAVIAALGGGLVIASHDRSPGPFVLAAGPAFAPGPPFRECNPPAPPPIGPAIRSCTPQRVEIVGRPPQQFPRAASVRVPGSALNPVGWIMLIVGVVGLVLLMVLWWAGRSRWSRRHAHIDGARVDHDWM